MEYFKQAEKLYAKACRNAIGESDLDTVIAWPREALSVLFAAADQVRRRCAGSGIEACAIMNVKSGGCPEDCAFCSQSAHNSARITAQALSGESEIIAQYREAARQGLSFGVVSSGRGLSASELEGLATTLSRCEGPTHASLGILDTYQFRMLRKAGVVCYNHNIETSRRFFPRIVSTHSYDDRVNTVRRAKAAGMHVCCGGIFGIGETWEDRKDMALELRELEVDTIPLNFLLALEGTRVTGPEERPLDFLRIISLFRFALPDRVIKVAAGREIHLGKLQPLIFYAGANGMISGDYLTTKGDSIESDNRMLSDLELVKGTGES